MPRPCLQRQLKISSMRAIRSSVNCAITSSAPRFSSSCSMRLAPVMTVLTLRFEAVHARASWASELAKPGPVLESPIYLNLTRSGDVIYDGQLEPLGALRALLLAEGIQLERQNKTPADATVIIRAHADAATGKVQELIQICQEARFEKFTLRAKEEVRP